MRNTQRWRNQWRSALKGNFPWKLNFLLLHLSGERSPSFPRPFIPNIEDWKTSQTFKVVYSGTWHHANRLRVIHFIIIPLTFVLIHSSHAKKTFPTVCCLDMKQISPDWSVSGFLGQSRFLRLILMWCDEMLSSPLLQLFQMRLSLLRDCRASSGARHC